MRKILIILSFILYTFSAVAQEQGKIRVGWNFGAVKAESRLAGAGIAAHADIKYNISDRLSVGVLFANDFRGKNHLKSVLNNGDSVILLQLNQGMLLTADYYFSRHFSDFAPFVGVSLGSFNLFNSRLDVNEPLITFLSTLKAIVDPDFVPAGILRAGFEYKRIRLALEYCYLPPTQYLANSLLEYETTRNDYLSLNIGFYLGGGKWKQFRPAANL